MDGAGQTVKGGGRRRGLKRRVVGWGLVVVGIGLMVVWWTDRWWWGGDNRWCRIGLYGSVVGMVWGDAEQRHDYERWKMGVVLAADTLPDQDAWLWREHDPNSAWRPPRVLIVRFPVWPLMVLALAGGVGMLWSVRRRRPGERRVALGAVSAATGVLLGVVWIVSGWKTQELRFQPLGVTASRGLVHLEIESGALIADFRLAYWMFAPSAQRGVTLGTSGNWVLWDWRSEGSEVLVPLWPFVLVLATGSVPLIRSGLRARRLGAGACAACGYDLAGLPPGAGAKCPECGKGSRTT